MLAAHIVDPTPDPQHVQIQMGGWGDVGSRPPEKPQKIRFLSNTSPDPLKNNKASKPAFNVGPVKLSGSLIVQMLFLGVDCQEVPLMAVIFFQFLPIFVILGLPGSGPSLPYTCISHAVLTAPLEGFTCLNQLSLRALHFQN